MKGEMKLAPAFAARIAWFAEKQSVTFTCVPDWLSARQVLSPSGVNGTFTATLLAILASLRPSSSMVG